MNTDFRAELQELFDAAESFVEPALDPPPATVEPMPLWRVMFAAYDHGASDPNYTGAARFRHAAEIEALRDWLSTEDDEALRSTLIEKGWVTNFSAGTLVRLIQRHYADQLTEQARIAALPVPEAQP